MMRVSNLFVLFMLVAACSSAPRPKAPSADPLREVTANSLYDTGIALANRGDWVRAEQYLVAARARGYASDRVTTALLRVCIASSRLHAAIGYAQQHLLDHPNDWRLRYLVATLHHGLGEIGSAHRAFARVARQRPEHADAHYFLGVTALDLAQPRQARTHLRAYLKLAPEGEHSEEAQAGLRRARQLRRQLRRKRHRLRRARTKGAV